MLLLAHKLVGSYWENVCREVVRGNARPSEVAAIPLLAAHSVRRMLAAEL